MTTKKLGREASASLYKAQIAIGKKVNFNGEQQRATEVDAL